MARDKKSFLMYCDWIHTVKKLDDETAGKLLKHLLKYVNDENPVPENQIIDLVFEPIKLQLKRDLKRYESIIAKRSEAGKASAEKRRQNATNPTSVESVEQTPTNPTDTIVNVNDNVTDNDNVTVLLKKETKKDFLTSIDFDKKEIFEKWLNYRKEIKKTIKARSTLESLIKKFNHIDLRVCESTVNASIENNYTGLFWEKHISQHMSVQKPKTINRQTEEVIRQNLEMIDPAFVDRIRSINK